MLLVMEAVHTSVNTVREVQFVLVEKDTDCKQITSLVRVGGLVR